MRVLHLSGLESPLRNTVLPGETTDGETELSLSKGKGDLSSGRFDGFIN